MRKLLDALLATALVLLLLVFTMLASGCNTAGKAIDSASQKSLVGSGFMTVNKITVVDSTTNSYTPQIFSMFLNGKYVSVLRNAKFLFYDRQSSASTFNANAVTTEENLIIQVNDKESMASVLAQLKEVLNSSEKADSSTETTTEAK